MKSRHVVDPERLHRWLFGVLEAGRWGDVQSTSHQCGRSLPERFRLITIGIVARFEFGFQDIPVPLILSSLRMPTVIFFPLSLCIERRNSTLILLK